MTTPPITSWFQAYQPVDEIETGIYNIFQRFFQSYGDVTQQQRQVSHLMNFLLHHRLIDQNAMRHPVYSQAIAKTFNWLRNTLILWTEPLQALIEQYCQTFPEEEIAQRCQAHLNELAGVDPSERRYRELIRHLQDWVKKLAKQIQATLNSAAAALKRFWEQLQPHIFEVPRLWQFDFDPQTFSLRKSLLGWIHQQLWKRLKNDKDADQDLRTRRSLDVPFGRDDEGNAAALVDSIPTVNSGFQPPTLKDIKNGTWRVPSENDRKKRKSLKRLQTEILRDDLLGILKSIWVNKNPACNYQVLAERLILEGRTYGDIQAISDEFGISYQTLNADIKRKFYPTIQGLLLDCVSLEREKIHQAIAEAPELLNITKSVKGNDLCSAAWLAQNLLLYYQNPAAILNRLLEFLQSKHPSLQSFDLITDDNDLFIFQTISQEFAQQTRKAPKGQLSAWKLYTLWQQSQFEYLSDHLLSEHRLKLSPEQLKTFWRDKCLVVLGKVAIDCHKSS